MLHLKGWSGDIVRRMTQCGVIALDGTPGGKRPAMKRGPRRLNRIWFIGRGEGFFKLNLDFQEARNGKSDAQFDLGFVADAPKNRADFLHQFCHSDLLLVTGNDAAQVTHGGAELHPQGRNAMEKGTALAAPRRCVMVRAMDWPTSKRRHVAAHADRNLLARTGLPGHAA